MTRENLKELLAERTGPCVSVYMPAITSGEGTRQNPIRFRKLLREAGKKLAAAGYKAAMTEKLLSKARLLLDDRTFWQHQSGGLALFLSEDVKRVYSMPLIFREMTLVSDHFGVTPLLPFFAEDGRFSVLALNQDSARFYQCSRHSVVQVPLERISSNIAELLDLNPREKQLQFHANNEGHGGVGGRAEMFHGHAQDSDESKSNILTYFQSVNRGINAMLKADGSPLVTAGVEYLTRIYAQANTYPNLYESSVCGSMNLMRPEELRDRAWTLVKSRFEEEALAAVNRYEEFLGTRNVSKHIREILAAAEEGRVSTLLVSSGAQRWGVFDPASGEVALDANPDTGDTELVDLCVTSALRHGGKVYVLEQSKMPGTSPMAAIFNH